MFIDRKSLRAALAKTVGFYQVANAVYEDLSPSLLNSNYGRFVNEVNGLITPENIDQSRRNYQQFKYDDWGGDTITYSEGDLRQDNGINYEAIQDVIVGIDIADTAYWLPLNDISEYLHQKRFQAVDKAIDSVINDKKIRTKIKSIYENIPLFDGSANYRDLEQNGDKFVGLRIRLKTDRDLITVLEKIGTQFTEVLPALTLYLYHSSQQAPIATFSINHSKANSFVWTTPTTGNILEYLSNDYNAGGDFFLGYAQSDLGTASALRMYNIDWNSGTSCNSCNKRSYRYYQNYSKWIDITGFSIPESDFTVGVDMFNPADASITPTSNFGLNLVFTNKCDLTPFFIEQESLFAEAIQYSTGLSILSDMASSVRGANGLSNEVAMKAEKETVTFTDSWGTVTDRTKKVFEGLSFDLSGLQSECLACDDGRADIIQRTVTLM